MWLDHGQPCRTVPATTVIVAKICQSHRWPPIRPSYDEKYGKSGEYKIPRMMSDHPTSNGIKNLKMLLPVYGNGLVVWITLAYSVGFLLFGSIPTLVS